MAHLVCTEHKLRTVILSDGTAVHRRNGSLEKCDTTTVRIGEEFYYRDKTMLAALNHRRHNKNPVGEDIDLTRIVEKAKDVGQSFAKFGGAIARLSPTARLLIDIFADEDSVKRIAEDIESY